MHTLRAILRSTASVLLAGTFGAMIWTFAVIAAGHPPVPGTIYETIARFLKDYATPIGVFIALGAFLVNTSNQKSTARKERQRHGLDTAIAWLNKAVEIVEAASTAADSGQPFYTAVTDLQLRSAAQLIDAAERSAQGLRESRFREHYSVEAGYTSSKLLQSLRFRGTDQFFDLRYYHAVQLGLKGNDVLASSPGSSLGLAAYHNDSVKSYEAFQGDFNELSLDEARKKDFRAFGFLLAKLRKGERPFDHPYIGAAVPLAATETILRFALRQAPYGQLTDVFPGEEVPPNSTTMGLGIVLYQCRYFELGADALVISKLQPRGST